MTFFFLKIKNDKKFGSFKRHDVNKELIVSRQNPRVACFFHFIQRRNVSINFPCQTRAHLCSVCCTVYCIHRLLIDTKCRCQTIKIVTCLCVRSRKRNSVLLTNKFKCIFCLNDVKKKKKTKINSIFINTKVIFVFLIFLWHPWNNIFSLHNYERRCHFTEDAFVFFFFTIHAKKVYVFVTKQ